MSIDRYTYLNDAPEILELLKCEKERFVAEHNLSTTEPINSGYDLPKTRTSTVPTRLNGKPVETIISAYFDGGEENNKSNKIENSAVILPYSGTESEKDLPANPQTPSEYWANMLP